MNSIYEQLRKIKLNINELARILGVSRPTMYKYIELFNMGKNIDSKYSDIFAFIESENCRSAYDLYNYVNGISSEFPKEIIDNYVKNSNFRYLINYLSQKVEEIDIEKFYKIKEIMEGKDGKNSYDK
ncbi:MAG: helix-turn-helix domain-containing protein [Christensenellaceae bacterium]|nr:helix-turn-helix domain-containing protein [Christensenellaceae bacterium]